MRAISIGNVQVYIERSLKTYVNTNKRVKEKKSPIYTLR